MSVESHSKLSGPPRELQPHEIAAREKPPVMFENVGLPGPDGAIRKVSAKFNLAGEIFDVPFGSKVAIPYGYGAPRHNHRGDPTSPSVISTIAPQLRLCDGQDVEAIPHVPPRLSSAQLAERVNRGLAPGVAELAAAKRAEDEAAAAVAKPIVRGSK